MRKKAAPALGKDLLEYRFLREDWRDLRGTLPKWCQRARIDCRGVFYGGGLSLTLGGVFSLFRHSKLKKRAAGHLGKRVSERADRDRIRERQSLQYKG